ncbi:MAG: hypothetical protein AAF705_05565 [Bacteroidota bacterium]
MEKKRLIHYVLTLLGFLIALPLVYFKSSFSNPQMAVNVGTGLQIFSLISLTHIFFNIDKYFKLKKK